MDFRQLRYFTQIAESGNFSRAAEVLRIAQPSLSQQIRNLEDELGVELFTRHARGAALTEIGQQFYDHARRILQSVDQAKEVIRSQAATPTGRISVGLPTSAARGLSLSLFRALADKQPNITLHVVEAMSGFLDDFIQDGRLDVALLYDHKAFEHVAWTEMIAEDLMLIVPRRSPLAHLRGIAFAEIFKHPLVLPGRPHVLRSVIETLALRHGIVTRSLDCDSLPSIAKLVCNEGYSAVMPHFAFAEEIACGELAAIPITDPTPSWRLSVVVSQRTLNLRSSEAVAKVLADVITAMVSNGHWRARLTETPGSRVPSVGGSVPSARKSAAGRPSPSARTFASPMGPLPHLVRQS